MNNLVYCVYGGGEYTREALFSLWSAVRFGLPEKANWRILIYAENPRPFAQFGATVELLDARRMREWAGPANFGHRRKIFALRHALRNYGPAVLLDTDTYFLKPPRKLFARIKSGHAVMHLCEGRLGQFPNFVPLCQSLCAAPFGISDQLYKFKPEWLMWNPGVVGLHPADEPLMEQVVQLTDAVHQRSPSAVSEQAAFTQVLGRATRLREAEDVVFHYWAPHLRAPFQGLLAKLVAEAEGASFGNLASHG